MDKITAIQTLSIENVTTALKVALALDTLQGIEFRTEFADKMPVIPESRISEMAEEHIETHVSMSFGAAGYGTFVNASILITLLKVLGFDKQAATLESQIQKEN